MAQGKKSFIAYSDWNGMFQALPDEVAGKLIKHIFLYVNDQNPKSEDYVVNALFEQIRSTLKRDLEKWERQREQRVEAGKRSAEVRQRKSTSVKSRQRNSTVSVNVNVNKDILIESVSSPPEGVDPLYFYIAKSYHSLFKKKGTNKTLQNAKLDKWVNTVRLLIEHDNVTVEQLVGIKLYWERGLNEERGVDTFWIDNVLSVASLRKKDKNDVYYYDLITSSIKKYVKNNADFEREIIAKTKTLIDTANGKK